MGGDPREEIAAKALWERRRSAALEDHDDDNGPWFTPNYDPDALSMKEIEEHFLRDEVLQEARAVLAALDEHEEKSRADFMHWLTDLCDNPPPPNEKLRALMAEYRAARPEPGE